MTLALNNSRSLLEAARQGLWWVPNALTFARIVMSFGILGMFLWAWISFRAAGLIPFPISSSYRAIAFYLAIAAVLTDFFDGWSARALGAMSETGKWFDPLADKVFSTTLAVAIAIENGWGLYLIPYAPTCGFLLWYGLKTSHLRLNRAITGASWLAKVKTAVLMGVQLLFLGHIAYGEMLPVNWRGYLFLGGLAGFAGAAVLNKLSLADYERRAHQASSV